MDTFHPCLHVVNTKKNETGTNIRIDSGCCDFRNARGDIALVITPPLLARCRWKKSLVRYQNVRGNASQSSKTKTGEDHQQESLPVRELSRYQSCVFCSGKTCRKEDKRELCDPFRRGRVRFDVSAQFSQLPFRFSNFRVKALWEMSSWKVW